MNEMIKLSNERLRKQFYLKPMFFCEHVYSIKKGRIESNMCSVETVTKNGKQSLKVNNNSCCLRLQMYGEEGYQEPKESELKPKVLKLLSKRGIKRFNSQIDNLKKKSVALQTRVNRLLDRKQVYDKLKIPPKKSGTREEKLRYQLEQDIVYLIEKPRKIVTLIGNVKKFIAEIEAGRTSMKRIEQELNKLIEKISSKQVHIVRPFDRKLKEQTLSFSRLDCCMRSPT